MAANFLDSESSTARLTSMADGNEFMQTTSKKKVPRKILHFSDGTVEEYSTDEDEEVTEYNRTPPIDPKTLPWLKWFSYYISTAAYGTLSAADCCGERLAWFFGITSPKYQYAIDEYNRQQAEDKEEQERGERERVAELNRMEQNNKRRSTDSSHHSVVSIPTDRISTVSSSSTINQPMCVEMTDRSGMKVPSSPQSARYIPTITQAMVHGTERSNSSAFPA